MKNFKEKLLKFFLEEQGGKKVINKRRALAIVCSLFFIGLGLELAPTLFKNDLPQGGVVKSDTPLIQEDKSLQKPEVRKGADIGGVSDYAPVQRKPVIAQRGPPIRYKARQVITPDASRERISSGANFVGKLLTSIDTRSPSTVSAILPYGGSHRSGGGALPPETILMGQFSYGGQGERVFMGFSRAILPDGQELAIRAQALSSKDYRAGVIGDYHSNKGDQMAATLGLTMISGVSEILVEKESLGNSYEATPKANFKNGFYNGIAKVTAMEATNQATRLGQNPSYVTIDAGSDLIISLSESMGTIREQAQDE